MSAEKESMEFDVVIVGAGPAGLSASIQIKKLAQQKGKEISVCVLEKGSEVGAHILSGAAFEPIALNELIPDWKSKNAPLNVPVTADQFLLLTEKRAFTLPTPPLMQNHGNYIISLANLCRWLGMEAANMGVEIYPGFAARELYFREDGAIGGVVTGDMGRDKDGNEKATFQPGIILKGKYTLFAEGCRGSLSEQLIKHFGLRDAHHPQTYAIGIKEIWQIDPSKHKEGTVIHTMGWPLNNNAYGGSFIYHAENHQLSMGLITGLDYENPYLSPFEEFQRFKTHPYIRNLLEGGKRIAYGARALNEGGFQSIPALTFKGGALIGCAAGFVNVAKIKGSHNAMKSGMLAAEAVCEALESGHLEPASYTDKLKNSWIYKELYLARNIRPAFHRFGFLGGLLYAALDTYLLRGRAPWTFSHREDHKQLKPAKACSKIHYPKPDGIISFDRLSSVYLANTQHDEDQPVHLTLKNADIPITLNLREYDAPEQRYCPAQVYEIVHEDNVPRLQINAANCVHCKTCDIKDPGQNIVWVTPEGGSGPNYPNM